MDRAELEGLDREALIERATESGIKRARILTRPELIDELLRLDPEADEASLRKSRGFFGKARDLVARVVERGLHLPDAAEAIRSLGTLPPSVPRMEPQAVPTVTLAEIYAAQGHPKRAVETLKHVLAREPEHAAAKMLLSKLTDSAYVAPPPPLPPEPEIEKPLFPREDEEEEASIASDDITTERFDEPAECVAIPSVHGRFVTWRVPFLRAKNLALRVVVVQPGWDGPTRSTRDIPIDRETGDMFVRDLPADAVVRVAVGTLEGDTFVPLAHSPAIESSTRPPGIGRWTLSGITPIVLDDPRSASIARAVHAARRVAS